MTNNRSKISLFLEDWGRLIAAIFIVIVILIISIIVLLPKKKQIVPSTINNTSGVKIDTSYNLSNDLSYAGFQSNYKDFGWQAKIVNMSEDRDEIEIYNNFAKINIATTIYEVTDEQTGYDSSLPEVAIEKTVPADFVFVKDKTFALSSPAIDSFNKTKTYKLLDKAFIQNTNGQVIIPFESSIFTPTDTEPNTASKTSISVSLAFDPSIKPEQDTETLEQVKKILASTDRISRKTIFIDKMDSEKIADLFKNNQHKFQQSQTLKYRLYIPDGYSLNDDPKLDQIFVSNGASTMSILKRSDKGENYKTRLPNLIEVSTIASRPVNIVDVIDGKYTTFLYSKDGKNTTFNPSTSSADNLLVSYNFSADQSLDNIKKTTKDFDLIISSITDNKPTSKTCTNLKKQSIPFKSPFCGNALEWTQVNQEFKPEHQAVDLVPNAEYYKNDANGKEGKEYFYATCDGEFKTWQDRDTKANVSQIQCKEQQFVVQYWHDRQSFWSFSGKVNAGDIVGEMGETGESEGKHLHYIIIQNGNKIDPIQLIKNN